MKLPHQLSAFVFAFYMSSFIGLAMSAVLTYFGSGLTPDYLAQVGKAYALAMPVGFLCVILFRPMVVVLMRATVAVPVPVEKPQAVD
jgi:hypothetical protein